MLSSFFRKIVVRIVVAIGIALLAGAGGAGLAAWRWRTQHPVAFAPVKPSAPEVADLAKVLADGQLQPSTREILGDAKTYELLSLDPAGDTSAGNFHGYRVLGRTIVSDRATQLKLNELIKAAADERRGIFSLCMFHPRHGLHIVSPEGVADLVICFECGDVSVYHNNKLFNGFAIASGPKPMMDDLLSAAGVELAK